MFASSSTPKADPHGPPITVVIPQGADASEIADILEQRGVITDSGNFHDYADSKSEGSNFQAGTYTLRAGTGYEALVAALDHGPAGKVKTLVIPEGYRLTQIEALLPSVGISNRRPTPRRSRAAVPPPGFGHHAEHGGLHVPGHVHDQAQRDGCAAGVAAAVRVRGRLVAGQHEVRQVQEPETDYDVLIIASMIEREARAPGDRSKVVGGRVQPAASRNGAGHRRDHPLPPRIVDGRHPSVRSGRHEPYNTRIHKGLPPTPICNPGLAAMQAAAAPKKVGYLYYVAVKGQAAQYFTKSYSEFIAHGG